MFSNWNPFTPPAKLEDLEGVRREQALRSARDRWHIHNKPRTVFATCMSPFCAPGVTGQGDAPDWYTPATCWACGSSEYTTPQPTIDRAEEEEMYNEAVKAGYE